MYALGPPLLMRFSEIEQAANGKTLTAYTLSAYSYPLPSNLSPRHPASAHAQGRACAQLEGTAPRGP